MKDMNESTSFTAGEAVDLEAVPAPPQGKHLFGTVQIGERGQVVIPKKARDMMDLHPGDSLVILGESDPTTTGLAFMRSDVFMSMVDSSLTVSSGKDGQ